MTTTRTHLKPSEVAAQRGIDVGNVLAWIRAGELPAIDVSKRRGGRPRWRIDVADLAAFEASRRNVQPKITSTPRRSRRRESEVAYF